MTDNFDPELQKVVELARKEARELQHDYVGTEHLLLGLLDAPDSAGTRTLARLQPDLERIRDMIMESIRRGTRLIPAGDPPFTSRSQQSLEFARDAAQEFGQAAIGTDALLVGLLAERKCIATVILNAVGVTLDAARAEVQKQNNREN